jgi:hypothetical protein
LPLFAPSQNAWVAGVGLGSGRGFTSVFAIFLSPLF